MIGVLGKLLLYDSYVLYEGSSTFPGGGGRGQHGSQALGLPLSIHGRYQAKDRSLSFPRQLLFLFPCTIVSRVIIMKTLGGR
jgi:hypothetical protein